MKSNNKPYRASLDNYNNFYRVWTTAWLSWYNERKPDYEIVRKPDEWQKRFGSRVITKDGEPNSRWVSIEFKTKGDYLLFMLEWS